MFRAVKPRIGNRCTASGDLCIRISGINRVLFSYCFRQFLRFRSDTHCFDCWRLDRDFTVTASLTVMNGSFNAIRHEGSKVFRNCIDASAIFTFYTRNLNPNFEITKEITGKIALKREDLQDHYNPSVRFP